MSITNYVSPLEKEGQNFIWYATTVDGNTIYECNDLWETKDFTENVYNPRYFIKSLGIIGKGCSYCMDLDILSNEKIGANMFTLNTSNKDKANKFKIPNIFLVHSKNPVEIHSLTTPTMTIATPKDDIFVRKYVHCDMRLVQNKETTAQSLIDYYALGYSNLINVYKNSIRYSLMLCVSNDNKKVFYKIQLTSLDKDVIVDLYAAYPVLCITDPHKTIKLKKNERVEFDYNLM